MASDEHYFVVGVPPTTRSIGRHHKHTHTHTHTRATARPDHAPGSDTWEGAERPLPVHDEDAGEGPLLHVKTRLPKKAPATPSLPRGGQKRWVPELHTTDGERWAQHTAGTTAQCWATSGAHVAECTDHGALSMLEARPRVSWLSSQMYPSNASEAQRPSRLTSGTFPPVAL